MTWLIAISDWQTGQATNSSFGIISRLSSNDTTSTILTDSGLMDDIGRVLDGLGLAGGDFFCGGPPPRSRPCPLNGMNDVVGVGFDTTPPCVGLASFPSASSGDATDGDLTVIVELPLFLTIPIPVTAFPLTELLLDEPKYPDKVLPLPTGLVFLPTIPLPLTGVFFLFIG